MEAKRTSGVWIVAAVLISLPVLYLLTYLATVGRTRTLADAFAEHPHEATYHLFILPLGDIGASVFKPANSVDRKVRPSFWNEPAAQDAPRP